MTICPKNNRVYRGVLSQSLRSPNAIWPRFRPRFTRIPELNHCYISPLWPERRWLCSTTPPPRKPTCPTNVTVPPRESRPWANTRGPLQKVFDVSWIVLHGFEGNKAYHRLLSPQWHLLFERPPGELSIELILGMGALDQTQPPRGEP